MDRIAEILKERGRTHGDLAMNADLAVTMEEVWRERCGHRWNRMSRVELLCLKMIALKIARILSSDVPITEHWDDVAGYAKLASDYIEGKSQYGDE